MLKTKAALAALWCCVLLAVPAQASTPDSTLNLRQAFALTLERHPELRRLPLQQDVLAAELEMAAQKPAWVAGASLENALGSGGSRAFGGAELTLSLGSVLESPARREARRGVARSNLAGLDIEAEALRLDLLAEVARRYLDVLAAQEEAMALAAGVEQRLSAAAAARKRVAAGASPASVQLGAEAALARARLELARTRATAEEARRHLALMWGGGRFDQVTGDLLVLPATPDFALLTALLDATPELQRFAGAARLREARLQLARSQARPETEWQVGLRRLQGSSDWALTGGLSVPLGSRRRSEPAIRAAQSELDAVALEREAGELELTATLSEAHGRLQVEALSVQQASRDVLPLLERAVASAGLAYRAGAISYLDWAQLQAELLDARRDRITAARNFHRALIEIQRLTAEPFVLAGANQTETLP